MQDIILSPLKHTWLIDIDGTIFEHNGYKLYGEDRVLPGVKEFFTKISDDTIILLTSRTKECEAQTIEALHKYEIPFSQIIFNCPFGERILINDCKPSGLATGISINLTRNQGFQNLKPKINPKL